MYSNQISAYDYSKVENQSNWKSTKINFGRSLNWAKIWERNDKKNFYLIADYNGLYLVPFGGGNQLNIIKPSKDNKSKPSAPFVTSRRSGNPLSDTLYIVSFTQPEPTVARYMEVWLASECGWSYKKHPTMQNLICMAGCFRVNRLNVVKNFIRVRS